MADTLKIYTLGRTSIQVGDTPVGGFISRKVEALLIYLACNRREHNREALAELLWDDLTQARAMGNLRTVLSSLQQQLAPYLYVTRYAVSMNPESQWWIDVGQLDAETDSAEQAWKNRGTLTREQRTRLEQAIELYQGDFLSGFNIRDGRGFENWKLMEQERLRRRVINTLYRLTVDSLEGGTFSAGINYARRLLQIDPLYEEAHQQLMLLLAQSGQRSAALAQFETAKQLLRDELDVEPAPETLELYERIQAGLIEVQPEPSASVRNLPMQATPFIPRPTEMGKIRAQLEQARLLTLVGPGGIGKTRLAFQAALDHAGDFRHGACVAQLTAAESGELLPQAILEALNIVRQPNIGTLDQLIAYLRHQNLLLVLDKFEHLLDSATLLSTILTKAPGVKIIVTSRERLNIKEEWILRIDGMPVPPEADRNLMEYESIQLFVENARRVKADFSLDTHKHAVVRICQLVQGLPLGIELAAAWVHVMAPDQIAAQIEHDLDFLTTSARNITERHRSVSRIMEQSWETLPDDQRNALMRLSVFKGGFGLEAATKVAGASIRILTALLEQSLIRTEASGRYSMLNLQARYANTRLAESGQLGQTQAAHAGFFSEWASCMVDTEPDAQALHNAFELDHDNLHAALTWAIENRRVDLALNLCTALLGYWRERGYAADGLRWLEQALAISDPDDVSLLRARALYSAGVLAWTQRNVEVTGEMFDESLRLYGKLRDSRGMERVLMYQGSVALEAGDYQEAQARFEGVLSLAIPTTGVMALIQLGCIAAELGNYLVAKARFEKALRLYQLFDVQDRAVVIQALRQQAGLGTMLENLAGVALIRGEYRRVAQLLGAATAMNLPDERRARADFKYMVETARGALGEAGYRSAWADGEQLSIEQALSLALEIIS